MENVSIFVTFPMMGNKWGRSQDTTRMWI